VNDSRQDRSAPPDLPLEEPTSGGSETPPDGASERTSEEGLGAASEGSAGEVEQVGQEAEEALDPVAAAAAERDEYLDALRRLQADFENYRKRVLKQQADQVARAAEGLVLKLLPVLDTVDLALAHVPGPAYPPSDGPSEGGEEGEAAPGTPSAAEAGALAQISGALTEVLTKEGLERIDPQGQPFDPKEHDAVMHEPGGEGGRPEVTEVLRAGYRWRGRVLRPAMVKVKG
jgi:molecular chaperone GrpE